MILSNSPVGGFSPKLSQLITLKTGQVPATLSTVFYKINLSEHWARWNVVLTQLISLYHLVDGLFLWLNETILLNVQIFAQE